MARNYGHYRELGVKIPEDLEPQEWAFYVLCAPNSPEWYTAVHSAVRLLARGRFWLRDDRENSIKTAAEIGGEIERSLMACNIDLEVLADAIKYLADNLQVNQTNNQSVTCGGSGGGDDGVLEEPINWPEDEPIQIFEDPMSLDPSTMTSQEKCEVAAFLADSWVETWSDIDTYWDGIGITIDAVSAWLSEKFPAGAVLPFIAFVITQTAILLETVLLGKLAGTMAEAAAYYHSQFICAVAMAESAEDARRRWLAVLANVRQTYGKVPYAIQRVVASALDWDSIMGNGVEVPTEYNGYVCPCGESDVYIQVYDNTGVIATAPIYVGSEVIVSGLRSDAYGPFMQFRFVDVSASPIGVAAADYQITGLNGWQQHNIPQHPFTIMTFDQTGADPIIELAQNNPITLPYTFVRAAEPLDMGQVQIASNVGTLGFTATIKRLA